MAGLLLLFLIMEEVCDLELGLHGAIFINNQPTVIWVWRLASKISVVIEELIYTLSLRLHKRGVSSLMLLHIQWVEMSWQTFPLVHLVACQSGITKLPVIYWTCLTIFFLYLNRTRRPCSVLLTRFLWKCFPSCGWRLHPRKSGGYCQAAGNTLEKLVLVRRTFGTGPLLARGPVPTPSTVSHRFRGHLPNGIPRQRKTDPKWDSIWRNHGH